MLENFNCSVAIDIPVLTCQQQVHVCHGTHRLSLFRIRKGAATPHLKADEMAVGTRESRSETLKVDRKNEPLVNCTGSRCSADTFLPLAKGVVWSQTGHPKRVTPRTYPSKKMSAT